MYTVFACMSISDTDICTYICKLTARSVHAEAVSDNCLGSGSCINFFTKLCVEISTGTTQAVYIY